MKKILSILTTLGIISPTVASVVACGPKISTNVLFVLPGIAMSSSSRITRSYQQIVRDFNNSEEMKDSKVKVEVGWESGDPVQLRGSVLEQLPDLYIAYPDVAAKYIFDPTKMDSARNMEDTYFGDELKDESLKEKFWSQAFYSEGLINNDLYVLPLNKSFDMSVVNLRVFLELASFVDKNLTNTIANGLKAENYSGLASHLFLENSVVTDTELLNSLKPALEKISKSSSKIFGIREFFKLNDNVVNLAKIYSFLYNNHLNTGSIGDYTNNSQKMYSIGIDSIANKLFMEYGDALNPEGTSETINPYKNENFFYQIKDINPDRERMEIVLDNPESKIFKGVNEYFNSFVKLANPKNANHSDITVRWAGSMMVGKIDGKTYTSDYFNQGTMLVTSSSTAGSWSFNARNKNKPQFNREKDLLAVSSSSHTGNNFNFAQQGPGLAGFKSVGKNAAQKEAVTTKFVRYLLQPKVQNRLAIMAGYIPSTVGALDFFKYYKDGSFDNQKGEWVEGVVKPSNADDFEKIYDANTTRANPQNDILISQLLNDFILPGNLNNVTAVGNPAGALIRSALDQALKTGFFKTFGSFDQILRGKTRNDRWSILGQFHSNLPGTLGSSTITQK